MSTETKNEDLLRGGQFLVKETKCEDVFTLEDLSEEQRMMRDSTKEFVDRETLGTLGTLRKERLCLYGSLYAQSR